MRAALQIALKDLRQRVRDKSAFLWGFLAPVGLAFIFSLALGGVADGDAITVKYGVADLDGGPMAEAFIDQALQPLLVDGLIEELTAFDSEEAVEAAVESGSLDAAFVIPPGFSEGALGDGGVSIGVVGYVDSTIGTQVARAIAGQMAGEINGIRTLVGTVCVLRGEDVAACADDQLAGQAQVFPPPLSVASIEAADKQLSPSTFYSAGMAVMFLFLTVQFGVLGLLEEKTNGTMGRLLAAPIPRWSIVFGKAITSFVLGVSSMVAIIVVTTLLPMMDADWGDPIGVAILVLAGVMAAMGVMMLIAAFARTPEQAQNLQAIVAFMLAMLGGAFFPVAHAGGLLALFSKLTPHSWFLRGLGDAAGDAGLMVVMESVWPILLFAAVTMALASLRLRRVVEP